MKFVIFAVLLVWGVAAALALPAKENLKTAEQFYYGAPVAYSAYAAYPAYSPYGTYYYR